MEFRKNVDRIASIKRDLDSQQERAEKIAVREMLLEAPQSDFVVRLEETRLLVEPLDRLWNTVKVPNARLSAMMRVMLYAMLRVMLYAIVIISINILTLIYSILKRTFRD